VTFHAHPDDEAIATGGVMAKAAADGHRVVLVVGTRGEQGEPVPGVLADGEALWERRVVETHKSAEILGAGRVEFLGYEDSGMMGEPTNDNPACFWQADVDEAAERLAKILREESADVLTIYDHHGGYGHPDHIQVHRVGKRAAELAGIKHVFQGTMNRTRILAMMEANRDNPDMPSLDPETDPEGNERPAIDEENFGEPEEVITHAIDVSAFVDKKRASMEAHASQISDESFFMKMPPDVFTMAFGTEWFVRLDGVRGAGEPFLDDLFADVDAAVAAD
jgi:LmbE family N-acetylglucosaminyl deacetylase